MVHRYLYLWYRCLELRRFLADARRARQIQREVLLEKVRRNADSLFGREHKFCEIRSIEDFRRRVPVTDYEYYRPYVDRVKQGDLGAMFGPGTRLLMFALTSGTTSKPKYIPVTQEFFNEYRRGWNLWGIGNYRDHTDLVYKLNLNLVSDWRQELTEGGIPCGNISGLATETAPAIVRRRAVVPAPVMKIDDPISKYYATLRLSMASPWVGIIATANPSTLLEIARLATERAEWLVRDLFDGTLSKEVRVSPEVRAALAPWVGRRHVRRARQLEALWRRTGALHPRDVWPRLSVLAVWLGGSVAVYLPRLKPYYGEPALRDHGLHASEGRMTIPMQDGTSAGLLDFLDNFFEFIPEAEHDRADPTVLAAHELEVDKNYYILLTTSSGLYRYDIHDVVQCVGFEGSAPILKFLSKGASFSSITGEKLTEFQIVSAVQSSFDELGLLAEQCTIAPVMGQRPGYVLLLEPGPHGGKEEELARRVEKHLARLNWEYREKRRSGRLEPLTVRQVPSGTWKALRARRAAESGAVESYKHPCLVNDLRFLERLLGSEAQVSSKPQSGGSLQGGR